MTKVVVFIIECSLTLRLSIPEIRSHTTVLKAGAKSPIVSLVGSSSKPRGSRPEGFIHRLTALIMCPMRMILG